MYGGTNERVTDKSASAYTQTERQVETHSKTTKLYRENINKQINKQKTAS